MKYNTAQVAALQPDYLGFIFYAESPRYFTGKIPALQPRVKKVGVFVNETIDNLMKIVTKYNLDVIQLHGEETPHYCSVLKTTLSTEVERFSETQPNQGSYGFTGATIWKVFGVNDSFNFEILQPYENCVDAFLFDTKGKNKGGNGITFNWDVLKKYPSKKPIILSGGIGQEEISALKEIEQTSLPIFAIDVNSKFESTPGVKNTELLKQFQKKLN